eukprot:649213-Pelagomonas_calceolata.AAC.9
MDRDLTPIPASALTPLAPWQQTQSFWHALQCLQRPILRGFSSQQVTGEKCTQEGRTASLFCLPGMKSASLCTELNIQRKQSPTISSLTHA